MMTQCVFLHVLEKISLAVANERFGQRHMFPNLSIQSSISLCVLITIPAFIALKMLLPTQSETKFNIFLFCCSLLGIHSCLFLYTYPLGFTYANGIANDTLSVVESMREHGIPEVGASPSLLVVRNSKNGICRSTIILTTIVMHCFPHFSRWCNIIPIRLPLLCQLFCYLCSPPGFQGYPME